MEWRIAGGWGFGGSDRWLDVLVPQRAFFLGGENSRLGYECTPTRLGQC